MDQLRAMKVFARVVDEGGFARAARALDLAPPVVTRVVAELEAHLGARLLNRTTRRVTLTEVGEQFLERSRAILHDVAEAEAAAAEGTRLTRGHLRVLCPPAIAVHQLAAQLPRFVQAYPQVTVELVTPGPVETLDEAFDITLFASRDPPDGDFIARRLARTEVIVCASPAYLDRRGRPRHPRDLAQHHAVLPPGSGVARGLALIRGPLGGRGDGDGADNGGGSDGGEGNAHERFVLTHDGPPVLTTSHIDTMRAAALAGLGIAGLPSYVVADALRARTLERVLPAWRLFDVTLWAGIPSRRHVPARTRAFVDFLLEIFGGEDRDPWLAAAGCPTAAISPSAAPAPALARVPVPKPLPPTAPPA